MNRHDREAFDRLHALPERTETQQQLLDNMRRWDEAEAHHDNRERDWHAQEDPPAQVEADTAGDYTGRYASGGSYADALARIDDVLADDGWQAADEAVAEEARAR